jgi:hypothetical protein
MKIKNLFILLVAALVAACANGFAADGQSTSSTTTSASEPEVMPGEGPHICRLNVDGKVIAITHRKTEPDCAAWAEDLAKKKGFVKKS